MSKNLRRMEDDILVNSFAQWAIHAGFVEDMDEMEEATQKAKDRSDEIGRRLLQRNAYKEALEKIAMGQHNGQSATIIARSCLLEEDTR